jgi:hypothetical protein
MSRWRYLGIVLIATVVVAASTLIALSELSRATFDRTMPSTVDYATSATLLYTSAAILMAAVFYVATERRLRGGLRAVGRIIVSAVGAGGMLVALGSMPMLPGTFAWFTSGLAASVTVLVLAFGAPDQDGRIRNDDHP